MNKQSLLLSLAFLPVIGTAQSWSSCSSDLDDLRRRASDASSIASSVDSVHQRYKTAQEDLRNCLQFPQIHDPLKNGCSDKRNDYNSAMSSYRSELSNLQSGLDDVNRKIKSSKDSCGVNLAQIEGSSIPVFSSLPTIPRPIPYGDPRCASYQSFKGQYPVATILKVCKQEMSDFECRACLSR